MLKDFMLLRAMVKGAGGGGITPTGDINITENGEFDVTEFAKAIVNVASGGGDEASVVNSLIERRITEISSNVTMVGAYAFTSCSKLTTVNMPLATMVDIEAFYDCRALTTVNIPLVTTIYGNAFYNCYFLRTVDMSLVTTLGSGAFRNCQRLKTANMPVVTSIDKNTFYGCSALTTVILQNETLVTLSAVSAFTSTPIANGTGWIYVPRALVDSYKSATNWSNYATQFRALEDYTVDGTITGELDESKI